MGEVKCARCADASVALNRTQLPGVEPEHFAAAFFRIEPEKPKLRVGALQRLAAAADLAEQPPALGEMCPGLVDDPPDDVQAILAAIERHRRLVPAFRRQAVHAG